MNIIRRKERKTMQEIYNKIVMEFEETKEDFIFKTIYPYCLHITEQRMSKERLKKLLLLGLEKEREIKNECERKKDGTRKL